VASGLLTSDPVPAVHLHDLPGDEVTHGPREELDDTPDLVDRRQTLERPLGDQSPLVDFPPAQKPPAPPVPGRQAVDVLIPWLRSCVARQRV